MNVDTLETISLSFIEEENQRTTKHPQISGLKVTHHVETIKKIRELELPHLKAMVGIPFTLEPPDTPVSKPFDLSIIFERCQWK